MRPPGIEVDLAHAFRDQVDTGVFDKQYLIHPVFTTEERNRPSSTESRLRRLIGVRVFLRAAQRWLRENAPRYDVFHGLGDSDLTLVPAAIAEDLGLPAVVKVTMHRRYLDTGRLLMSWIATSRRHQSNLRRVSRVVALTEDIRRSLLGFGVKESRIAVIANGVDGEVFRPSLSRVERHEVRKALGLADRFTIVFVGEVSRRKRPHLVVAAGMDLLHQGLDLQVMIVGPEKDAQYVRHMKRLVAARSASDRVLFLGYRRDIPSILRAADVLCLPSSKEGMPNAVIEAMATGLPVIATKWSGVEAVVRHNETGLLVEADSRSVSQAIATYHYRSSMARRHGRNGREWVEARFGYQQTLDRYLTLFDSVARRKAT